MMRLGVSLHLLPPFFLRTLIINRRLSTILKTSKKCLKYCFLLCKSMYIRKVYSIQSEAAAQRCSVKNTHFTNLDSFEIENNMFPKYSQKTFSVYKLSTRHVSVCCQKKYLRCTISWRLRTTFLKQVESKYLYNSVYFSKTFLFQRRVKILSGGMGGWGGWIVSLRQLAVWVS